MLVERVAGGLEYGIHESTLESASCAPARSLEPDCWSTEVACSIGP
jgi:hypothetical protein